MNIGKIARKIDDFDIDFSKMKNQSELIGSTITTPYFKG